MDGREAQDGEDRSVYSISLWSNKTVVGPVLHCTDTYMSMIYGQKVLADQK